MNNWPTWFRELAAVGRPDLAAYYSTFTPHAPTQHKENPVSENRTRTLTTKLSREIETSGNTEGDVFLAAGDTFSPRTQVTSRLTRAQARELALNLLVAAGDAPAEPPTVERFDSAPCVPSYVKQGNVVLTDGELADEMGYIGNALSAVVHGPAALKAHEDELKEAAAKQEAARERKAGIDALVDTGAVGHITAARLYDAGVRAPQ